MWDAVRRWGKVAIPAGVVLGIVAGLVAYLLFTPQYEAAAWIQIDEVPMHLAFESRAEGGQSKAYVQTQIELLRHPRVIAPVLANAEIAGIPEIAEQNDPARWLSRQVRVKQVGQSELYTVAFACSSPKGAAQVVNAVLDSYFKLREQEDAGRTSRVVELLDQASRQRAGEVSRLRESVRELAKQVTGRDPFIEKADGQQGIKNPLSELQARLVTAEVEEEIYKARVQALGEFVAKQPVEGYEGLVERNVEMDHEVQALKATIAKREELAATRKSMLSEKNPDDANHQESQRAIARDQETLDKRRAQLREELTELAKKEVKGKRDQDLAALRGEWENRRITKQLLGERYKSELGRVQQLSGNSLDLKFKQDELARAEKVFDLIAERSVRLQTERGAPPRVARVQNADPPVVPEQVFPFKTAIPATLIGLCLPMALAVLRERLLPRIGDPGTFEKQCNLKVVAEVSRFPAASTRGPGRGAGRTDREAGMFEESIDSLRTNLALADHGRPLRVLAVTSAVNDEGKTSVAVQLAVSLAKATDHLTLLVDADLRSPGIHNVFDVPLEPGLADVLAGKIAVEKAIVPIAGSRLHVLPAGKLRGSPHRLLASGELQCVLAGIPAEYEHVIIDTPPVLAASEAQVLARSADGAIVCAMRDVSRAEQVRKASERLLSSGAYLVGAVFNGVPTGQYVRSTALILIRNRDSCFSAGGHAGGFLRAAAVARPLILNTSHETTYPIPATRDEKGPQSAGLVGHVDCGFGRWDRIVLLALVPGRHEATAFLERAESFEADGDWGDAANCYHSYLQLRDDPKARIRLAEAYDKAAGNPRAKPRVIEHYYQALASAGEEEQPRLRLRVAELQLEVRQFALAVDEVEKLGGESRQDPRKARPRAGAVRVVPPRDVGQQPQGPGGSRWSL